MASSASQDGYVGASGTPKPTARVIISGSTAVALSTLVTLGTGTRVAGEKLLPTAQWVQENVAQGMMCWGASNHGSLSGIACWQERTVNANEFLARAANFLGPGGTLNLDWHVIAESLA